MAGQVSSLNVSVAGAVVMYEALRQRRTPAHPTHHPNPPNPAKASAHSTASHHQSVILSEAKNPRISPL